MAKLMQHETNLLYTLSLQSGRDGTGIGQQGDLSGGETALGCLDCDDRPEGPSAILCVAGGSEDDGSGHQLFG